MKKYISVILIFLAAIVGALMLKYKMFYRESTRTYNITRHRDFDQIKQSGYLVVGTTINPISFYYNRDAKAGFEYEIMKQIAQKLQVKLKIITVANDSSLYTMIRKGQIDIAMNQYLSLENEYTKDFVYTEPFLTTHITMVSFTKKDTLPYNITQRIPYSKIYIPKYDFDHISKEYILSILPNYKLVSFEDTSSSFELMRRLANRDSSILITWDYLYELSNLPDLKNVQSQEIAKDHQMTFICARSNFTLADTINKIIPTLLKKDSYKNLCSRYLSNKEIVIVKNLYEDENKKFAVSYKKGAISIYDELIKKYAKQHKLDWKLVAAVIHKESGFNPNAESPYGASGLMQLMPETGKRFGADSLFNPEQNIKAGCSYLKYLTQYWNKRVNDSSQVMYFVLASYNCGQGHVIDAQNLATKYGGNPNIWYEQVELYLSLKSDPKYYTDPICKLGYCRSTETISFVKLVSARHQLYSQIAK